MAKQYVVDIDPGHGGSDPGIVRNGLREKDLTLTTSLYVREELLKHSNVKVNMSRTSDTGTNLSTVCSNANKHHADVFVSIHYNGGGGDGAEFWCSHYRDQGEGDELGRFILEELKNNGQQSRGLKSKLNSHLQDYFAAVRIPKCASGIIEVAFIDNWNDIKDYDTDEELKKAGIAIAHGILRYLGIEPKDSTMNGSWVAKSEWWYRNEDGSYPANEWKNIHDKWYHFDENGWMQTGWLEIDGQTFYLLPNGEMATGWQKISGKWYYFYGSGQMAKDYLTPDGYYVGGDGVWDKN